MHRGVQNGNSSAAHGHVQLKSNAFREFAATLCAQVVEQICGEFEREAAFMYDDLTAYRGELERVAELLGHQLHRERSLHDMLANVGDIQSSMVAQVEGLQQQQPDVKSMHDMVDMLASQHVHVVNATVGNVSQATMQHTSQLEASKLLQEPMITAEAEFNRIMQLLQQPMIPGSMPISTMAPIDRNANPIQMQRQANVQSPVRNTMLGQQTPPASPSPIHSRQAGGVAAKTGQQASFGAHQQQGQPTPVQIAAMQAQRQQQMIAHR